MMRWIIVSLGCCILSLCHAQTLKKLSPTEACRDIDSLYHYYVDQSTIGCDNIKATRFRIACDKKKSAITDSITVHALAFELAELMAGCNDAHFSLDWMYLNRKFPRGNGFFPYRYIATRNNSALRLVITEYSRGSEIDGAEWLELNGVQVADLIQWAAKYVSVEEGADTVRDYIAACWLPWLLAQSDHLKKSNEWSLRSNDNGNVTRAQWPAIEAKELEARMRNRVSKSDKSGMSYSIHGEKAVLKISTFAPKNTLRSLRKLDRFFRVVNRKHTTSILLDLRDNGGGNSAFVEYLYSFLDTAGVSAPQAIIQRSSEWAKRRLLPWTSQRSLLSLLEQDEDARAALRLLSLPDGTCDTVYLHERIHQRENRVYNGECFVAVNGQTASAAAHFAALMQRNGKGRILGQPCNANTTDSGGNAIRLTLRASGIRIIVPMIRYINFEVDNSVRKPLLPDIEIWPDHHDISQRDDAIINWFLQHE